MWFLQLLVLIPLVQVVALNAEIGSLNKSIKKLSIINDVVNEYYSAKDKYNDIAAFAALTSDSDDALQDFVDYLEKSMPSDITICSLSMLHQEQLLLMVTAGSKSSVAKFIQELTEEVLQLLNVDAPTITETKDNAGTIEVTFSSDHVHLLEEHLIQLIRSHLIHQTVLKIAVLRVQQQSRRGVRWIS